MGDPGLTDLAHRLLVAACRALGRGALAEIAALHHRHRALPEVGLCR